MVKWEPLGEFDVAFQSFLKEREKYKVSFVAPDAKILVVDDNEINLKVFVNLLKETRMPLMPRITTPRAIPEEWQHIQRR